ncbi:MAG: SRPBCC family protein [bacterium]
MQDKIETEITVAAPIGAVWRAVTDYREFGTWFRAALDGPFTVGLVTTGKILEPGYEGTAFWVVTREMDGPFRFAFDWPAHPDTAPEAADQPGATTRVSFDLEKVATGTRIRLTESGFDLLPPDLSVQKFRDNQGGWVTQMGRIKAHVDG